MRLSAACTVIVTLAVLASSTTGEAQEVQPWILSAEGGTAEIHRASSDGGMGGLRLHRVWLQDRLRADASVLLSGADDGFVSSDVGVEVRLLGPGFPVSPYLGTGAGLIAEPEYGGAFFRVDAGLEVKLGKSNVLRVGFQRATHGGESGPHLITVAIGHRLGKAR